MAYPNIQAKSSGWNHKRPVIEKKTRKREQTITFGGESGSEGSLRLFPLVLDWGKGEWPSCTVLLPWPVFSTYMVILLWIKLFQSLVLSAWAPSEQQPRAEPAMAQGYPRTTLEPLSSTKPPRGHTHTLGQWERFKIPTPRARTSHTAFGGSPNHAHKRCNRYSQPANFGTKHLILWASLQHARWTWTLPLSFISTHTTWNRHTLKHKLWKLPDRNQDLMLWTYYGSTLFQAAHDFLTFKDALLWCS